MLGALWQLGVLGQLVAVDLILCGAEFEMLRADFFLCGAEFEVLRACFYIEGRT